MEWTWTMFNRIPLVAANAIVEGAEIACVIIIGAKL